MLLTRLEEICFIPYAHGELVSILFMFVGCSTNSKPYFLGMCPNLLVWKKIPGIGHHRLDTVFEHMMISTMTGDLLWKSQPFIAK